MYKAIKDTYCYPGTEVLRNKLDLRTPRELSAFESEISTQRAGEPLPEGAMDYRHYRQLHKHLFQDVYAWAGKIRSVRMSKGDSMFCYPENIDREMSKLFDGLARENHFCGIAPKEFATKAAHFLAELNAIHPFREGNGRTQLSFLSLLSERAGHLFDSSKIDPTKVMKAMIASFVGKEDELAGIVQALIQRK